MEIAARSVVLAVDEDPVMRKFVRRILGSAGFGCVEAADGESGLELAVEAGVSAAVVDLMLPGMSGAELAWRLREEIPGLPVVAVSRRLDLWDADDLMDLGICEVLPKPFEPKKLVRAVADALAHPFARPKSPTRGSTELAEVQSRYPAFAAGAASAEQAGDGAPLRRGEGPSTRAEAASPWEAPRRSRRPAPPDGKRLESAAGDEPKRRKVPHGTH